MVPQHLKLLRELQQLSTALTNLWERGGEGRGGEGRGREGSRSHCLEAVFFTCHMPLFSTFPHPPLPLLPPPRCPATQRKHPKLAASARASQTHCKLSIEERRGEGRGKKGRGGKGRGKEGRRWESFTSYGTDC